MRGATIAGVVLVAAACGGGAASKPAGGGGAASDGAGAADPAAAYAPLEVGADHASYTKVNKSSFLSPTHGKRFVDIYVNDVGLAAYQSGGDFPVGSVIVKTSWESKDGQPTDVAGPIFVMEKRAAGFAPDRDDWWYGLHWEDVPETWRARMGGASQVYWRSPSQKVDYCAGCHEVYDHHMGLPPEEQRAWTAPAKAGE